MSSNNKKGLKGLVPGKEFVQGTFNTVSFQKMIQHFINYVQQTPIPSIDTNYAQGNVSAEVIKSLKEINKSLSANYTKIQNDAQTEMAQVHHAEMVLGEIWHFSRIGEVVTKAIYTAVKNSSDPLGETTKNEVTRYLKFIDTSLARLESAIPSDAFDSIHKKLNQDISNLNTDFTNMQNAIPSGDGAKLNLKNLTEKQAKADLDQQISSLNSDISTLQQQIAWETVGQVGIGIVGGVIAVTNFWNPVGWVAAAGTVAGEVELAKDKASKKTQVSVDQTKIFVSEAEESILKPYYATKHYATQIKTMVAGLESLSQGIGNIRTYIDASVGDMEGFISDLGDASMLEMDYTLVQGDFSDLTSCIHTLMGSEAFSNKAIKNPKWTTMANDGEWQKIVSDPKSPFYIKLMAQMKAEDQSK